VIRMRKFDETFTDDSRYIALILRSDTQAPVMKVLENGQQLETRYAKYYRNAIQQKILDDYSYEQYWSAIDTELQNKKVIYFSPDGVYNQRNLNTLRRPHTQSESDYIVKRYDITGLGNSKDLIALRKRKAVPPT